MKYNLSKIALLIVITAIIYSCSPLMRVPDDEMLLVKNEIIIDNQKVAEDSIQVLLYQKPNSSFLKIPIRLYLYHLSKKDVDSSYVAWLNKKPNRKENLINLLSEKQVNRLGESFLVKGYSNFFKKVGEAPIIIDETKIEKSKKRLNSYYNSIGYFDNEVKAEIDSIGKKRGKVTYTLVKNKPYLIDSISSIIETKIIDSMYQSIKNKSYLKLNKKYIVTDFEIERKRITNHFRNNGAYYFQENDINYDVYQDTITKKLAVDVKINDRNITVDETNYEIPHKIYKIEKVNVYVDNDAIKDKSKITDSITYKNYTIYGSKKIKYRPKAITNAIFISKDDYYSDNSRFLTSRSLSNLNVFNYPNIDYKENKDSTALITNINLSPFKKYNLNPNVDFIHSNIQDFGIAGNLSVTFRNVFRGAELLQVSTRGNVGSSKDLANPKGVFFNLSEYGADAKLTFPRIFFLFPTSKLIRKEMLPSTNMSVGLFRQTNIGLDKENFSGIIDYSWTRKINNVSKFELLNLQYVRNLNINNYFNVYGSSYDDLNAIAQTYNINPENIENGNLTSTGAVSFINDVITSQTSLTPSNTDYQTVRSIGERRQRLIENYLIAASSFTFSTTNKSDIYDNSFHNIKVKLETAGNVISLLTNVSDQPNSDNGNKTLFGVEYAQYIKGDFEYIKHWDLGGKRSYAMRSFVGLAVPYGNSNSIPFSKSYFSGGSNDNRGWQPYALGPGSSGGINDFNEANFKMAFNAEYRFPFFGQLYGAFFADAGNIWNVFDNVEDKSYTFNGISSLKDIALGTGIGFRYDFSFFVFRLDFGYKTYNPGRPENERWFRDLNFNKTVLNFGINYPF
ncbi:BamA/TamA family outer membrane protein [uncultured Flavobacterium sp.]|uniref:translocation and assembly module lipoprotein TamL n=1 Tax=uncultured Flavobacterium sp. TaxID=165435 RepID=UPI0030EEE257